jgi:hypothetical protein
MSLHRSLAAGLWLVAAVGAYALAALWADDAQRGKVHPCALVALFWGVAAVSVAIHHLSRYLAEALAEGSDALRRRWSRLEPRLSALAVRLADDLATRLSRGLAMGAEALDRGWARHWPLLELQARRLADALARGSHAIKRSWHKPALGAHIRWLPDHLAFTSGAVRRDRAGRHKAAAG